MKKSSCPRKIVLALLLIGVGVTRPPALVAADGAPQTGIPIPPTPAAPEVSPAARHELEAVREAYAKLKSLQLHGVMTGEMEMEGKKQTQRTEFDCAFLAPNMFKYASIPVPGNPVATVFGSTGDRAYYLIIGRNAATYVTETAPKNREEIEKTTGVIATRIKLASDPGLKLALAADAEKLLASSASDSDGATRLTRGGDVTLDGKTYTALTITSATIKVIVLVDPRTHLLRRTTLTGKMPGPNGMAVLMTYDYVTIKPDASVLTATDFAWTPPAGAIEKLTPEEVSAALTGHPAPDVTLPGIDGATVEISSLKGSVVVLDFWATWCGPCVRALPHLNELCKEKQAGGLKVFAVDERESKQIIAQFIAPNHYVLPVLMDDRSAAPPADPNGFGAAAQAYRVSGIPQTVIIGKDGNVKNVFVGFGPDSVKMIRQAVEAALTER